LLQAQLAPLFPLVSGLQAQTAATPLIGTSGYPVSSLLTTDATGTPGFTATIPGPLTFLSSTVLTPTALTVNTNNYAPSGIAAAAVARVSATGGINVTGLIAAARSQTLLLVNIGAFTITLTNADVASTAANRFRCPGAANFALTTGKACWLWYDLTSTVWQVVG